jgi:hypothetical protein
MQTITVDGPATVATYWRRPIAQYNPPKEVQ